MLAKNIRKAEYRNNEQQNIENGDIVDFVEEIIIEIIALLEFVVELIILITLDIVIIVPFRFLTDSAHCVITMNRPHKELIPKNFNVVRGQFILQYTFFFNETTISIQFSSQVYHKV